MQLPGWLIAFHLAKAAREFSSPRTARGKKAPRPNPLLLATPRHNHPDLHPANLRNPFRNLLRIIPAPSQRALALVMTAGLRQQRIHKIRNSLNPLANFDKLFPP